MVEQVQGRRSCWCLFVFFINLFSQAAALVDTSRLMESYESNKKYLPETMIVRKVFKPVTTRPDSYGGACVRDDIHGKVDLFLPMNGLDLAFAPFLFRSIELFMPCFGDLVVLLPTGNEAVLFAGVPPYAYVFVVDEPLPRQYGYLSQQVYKVYADLFTSNEYILILETDMVFDTPEIKSCHFDEQGKIRVFCRDFAGPEEFCGPNCDIWKVGTEHALGIPMERDCLMRTPVMIPRKLLPDLRGHMEKHHSKSMMSIMTDYFSGHSKGWEVTDKLFSEFNIFHRYAYEYMQDQFSFTIIDRAGIDMFSCARHIGAEVHRNSHLQNPKLVADYFNRANAYLSIGFCEHNMKHSYCTQHEE